MKLKTVVTTVSGTVYESDYGSPLSEEEVEEILSEVNEIFLDMKNLKNFSIVSKGNDYHFHPDNIECVTIVKVKDD